MSFYLVNKQTNKEYCCNNNWWRQLLSIAYDNGWRPIINSDWQPSEDDHNALWHHFEYERKIMNKDEAKSMASCIKDALVDPKISKSRLEEFIIFSEAGEFEIH